MFDELVESNVQNDLKKRRKFFAVSFAAVGFLFSVAVVVSIYAADYSLGANQFELVEMITPVDPSPAAPEPEQRRAPSAASPVSSSQLPTRQANIARIDEAPTEVPTNVSTVRNTQATRPIGPHIPGKVDTDPSGSIGAIGRETGPGGGPTTGGLGNHTATNTTTPEAEDTTPPPAVKPIVPKKPDPPKTPVSKGVLNGRATDLPKPNYPAPARAVGAQGLVTVQVTIDEVGRVISANAVSDHVMLRAEAERAARNARFSPTLLSDVPVKVTGVITYNFTK